MSDTHQYLNWLTAISGIKLALLIWLVVKVTRVETLLTTHDKRIDKLEDPKP